MNDMNDSLIVRLQTVCRQRATAVALFEWVSPEGNGGRTVDFSGLWNFVVRVGSALRQAGVSAGDRVGVILETRWEWPVAYFGILYAGATAVPVDSQSTAAEVSACIRDAECRAVIIGTGMQPLLMREAASMPSVRMVMVVTDDPSVSVPDHWQLFCRLLDSASGPDDGPVPPIDGSAVASLVYTSGTTSRPKGVMLTHANFNANLQSIHALQVISERDVALALLPLHHVFPFMATLLAPVLTGATTVFCSSMKGEDILRCIRRTGVSVLVGVPQLLGLIARGLWQRIGQFPLPLRWSVYGLSRVCLWGRRRFGLNPARLLFSAVHARFGAQFRFFVCGGAKLPESTAELLWRMGFTVLEGYGLTETAPIVTFTPPGKERIGSCGPAAPGVTIRIDRPDANGVGEIVIRGDNVMAGYYRMPEQTAEVIRDGWFCSGDLGRVDADGYVYITGRKKEVIVLSSGKNVYPEDVEAAYSGSPFIKELCVVAVACGAEEKLAAVVVPDLDHFRRQAEVNIRSALKFILEGVSQQLPAYRRIHHFVVSGEPLLRTRLGKLKRFAIAEAFSGRLQEGEADSDLDEQFPAWEPITEIARSVRDILSRQSGVRRPLSFRDNLELDLGIDSLGRVELFEAIERKLNRRFPESVLSRIFTVGELIAAVETSDALSPASPEPDRSPELTWAYLLAQPPSDSVSKQIDVRPRGPARAGAVAVSQLLRILFRFGWRLNIYGSEYVPRQGPYLICPNHTSFLDGFIIAGATPAYVREKLFFIGARAYFEAPLVRTALKWLRTIPIDPAQQLVEAMRACALVLRAGNILCIFPEGGRSADGDLKEFKKGVGILAQELDIPIVPAYIHGSFESWPRTRQWPRLCPIRVRFGPALTCRELAARGRQSGTDDRYEAIARGLQSAVRALSGASSGCNSG